MFALQEATLQTMMATTDIQPKRSLPPSVTRTESASVHKIDHIESLISYVLREAEERGHHMQLWSKTWNQVDTYKQVLLSEHAHENDPYLVVCCPQTRSPKIFKQKVLPFGFGCICNRFLSQNFSGLCGRDILTTSSQWWKSGPLDTRIWQSCHFSACLVGSFGLKNSLPAAPCEVLGMEFDLRMSGGSLTTVCNTSERVVWKSWQSHTGWKAQKKRGRLQIAGGQLFGPNHLKNCCGCTSRVADSPSVKETVFALSSIWDQLNANKLRKILGSLSDHIHAYVDVSFDDTGYSGVGGVLFDCDGTSIGLLQWKNWPTLVDLTKAVDQETII